MKEDDTDMVVVEVEKAGVTAVNAVMPTVLYPGTGTQSDTRDKISRGFWTLNTNNDASEEIPVNNTGSFDRDLEPNSMTSELKNLEGLEATKESVENK